MILVDSSVWIDFFRNEPSVEAEWLDRHLGSEPLLVGDLILAEVLQGFKGDRGFMEARRLLLQLARVELGGFEVAVDAARHYRRLRAMGVTVRGTVDMLIATRCLRDGLRLLHRDRDFDAIARHLNLRVVDCGG